MSLPQHFSRRRAFLLTVLVMGACACGAQAEEVWLDAHGDGEYLLAPLSAICSWSVGGALGIEARDLFVTGPLLRVQLGYGEYLPVDAWVSYMRTASAVAFVGFRASLGSFVGLTPYAGGGIGVVFSSSAVDAAAYSAGSYTPRIGTQALGEAGLAMDVLIGRDFELRLTGAYRLMGESAGVYSGVRAGVGMGWKTPLGQRVERGGDAEQTSVDAAKASTGNGTAKDVDAALSDLAKYPNIRIVRVGNTVQLILEATFKANSAELSGATKTQLDAVGKAASKLGVSKVAIRGYVAQDQDSSTDVDISLSRANAVASWLKAKGYLAGVNVETAGMGRADPVADNSTEENRARNRRVEILLTME